MLKQQGSPKRPSPGPFLLSRGAEASATHRADSIAAFPLFLAEERPGTPSNGEFPLGFSERRSGPIRASGFFSPLPCGKGAEESGRPRLAMPLNFLLCIQEEHQG